MKAELRHVGVGCNRVVNAVSWKHENGLIAYAAHHAVIIYDPQAAHVVGTLLGHTGNVNCVCWIPNSYFEPQAVVDFNGPALLASGSADNSVHVWLWGPPSGQPWDLLATLKGHAAPVTSITTFPLAPGHLLLATTSGDGDVLIWECRAASPSAAGQDSWQLRQRIRVGLQMQECAALARLPADPDWLVLALGGVDARVRLYCCPPGGEFLEVCQLAGHQDWVRGLAFTQVGGSDGRLLLASASQDKYVRVWAIQQPRISPPPPAPGTPAAGDGPATAAFSAGLTASPPPGVPPTDPSGQRPEQDALATSAQQVIARYAPQPRIVTPTHTYTASLEALLIGHEDWVHSVTWQPDAGGAGGGQQAGGQPPCLLSASMDRTMMIWKPHKATALWMCVETVGDAGPNHLGYYTGVFNCRGSALLSHGFTGALHIWERQGKGGAWAPQHALGGHFAPVVDACWGVGDACLLTVSVDQTARITSRLSDGHWCEIARPQVHGHDFSTAAFIPLSDGTPPRTLYACGAEEKVIRVFEAPTAFRDTLAMARGEEVVQAAGSRSAFGAALPALGLSNKAVYADEGADDSAHVNGGVGSGMPGGDYTDGPDLAPNAAPSAVQGPPLEEHLAQNTLWPEVRKLYGHGNDVYCLAADPLGRFLASACRAQSASAAEIWLWDVVGTWVGMCQLEAHTLTVTQLAFSPDGRFLASASRDRRCALFQRCVEESPPFRLACKIKAHSRIVWTLGWSADSQLLATGSRDNTVKLWSVAEGQVAAPQAEDEACLADAEAPSAAAGEAQLVELVAIKFGDAVRAVAFSPVVGSSQSDGQSDGGRQPGSCWYSLAVGLEDGSVHVVEVGCSAVKDATSAAGLRVVSQSTVWQTGRYNQHAAAVRRLCWRRDTTSCNSAACSFGAETQTRCTLASVGEDHAVRVYYIEM